MPSKQVQFDFERETKGAVRYKERQASSLDLDFVGTLYVRKTGLKEMGLSEIPKTLRVTVEVE